MQVTIFLNEARGSFDGFDANAELVDGFTFTTAEGTTLDEVYTLANVGGDLYPHTAWSAEYRRTGHRSLSVGDVVQMGDNGYFAVARAGFDHVEDVAQIALAQLRAEQTGAADEHRANKVSYIAWLALQMAR